MPTVCGTLLMLKIKEVIVVEGKADTDKLAQVVAADTIETTGSALPDTTLQAIKTAAKTRGVIVFTDPDFNGERLRKLIAAQVPEAKHAFLTKDEAGRLVKHHSLGIEYAEPEAIEKALGQVYTAQDVAFESDITRADLMRHGLMAGVGSANRREHVAERLGLGYVNGKQLLKRLHMFGVTNEELQTVLAEMDEENNHG
jgi:ribonuclease M5